MVCRPYRGPRLASHDGRRPLVERQDQGVWLEAADAGAHHQAGHPEPRRRLEHDLDEGLKGDLVEEHVPELAQLVAGREGLRVRHACRQRHLGPGRIAASDIEQRDLSLVGCMESVWWC